MVQMHGCVESVRQRGGFHRCGCDCASVSMRTDGRVVLVEFQVLQHFFMVCISSGMQGSGSGECVVCLNAVDDVSSGAAGSCCCFPLDKVAIAHSRAGCRVPGVLRMPL